MSTDSSYLMFCGSYTNFDILAHLPSTKKLGKGVYCFHFHNGQIKPLSIIASLNPAVLSHHPSDPHTLYVLSEGITENGMISKLVYNHKISDNPCCTNCTDLEYKQNNNHINHSPQINIKIIDYDTSHQQTNGKSLCYWKIDPISKQYGIAINYWDGSIDVYSMQNNKINKLYKHINTMELIVSLQSEEESIQNKRRQVSNRHDHWENRQVGPHPHSIHYYKNWVFIPDLGENSIFQYAWNPAKNIILQYETQIKLIDGNGPRHMVFHPILPIVYVSNELSSSITVLKIDDSNINIKKDRLKIIQHINTDKNMIIDKDIYKKNYVAEIDISKDGKFIYCSNRGYDTIAIFEINKYGMLNIVSYVSTYGQTPRHFSITPDNKWLISANQDSNNLVIFKRNLENGLLILYKKYDDIICAPNYVLFAPFNVCENNSIKVENNEKKSNGYNSTIFMLLCLIIGILCKVVLL